ncbi:2-hydroxychromene-2-carboxylate isomerase [Bradyrhizobium sp. LHD-71]|uniref:2-hydroxychromene-2-carboxylate isomerase n=1 Tax=Bradyrhizobium sp. LHD-71 TaxID=3072141 RepID=UPI00280D4D3D|nr:2-hydroxychromene-2-carboxylate isomerase [Bradyrhizobium sp. LHD-71]MDQ8729641.1 2-hydroxychromene-2-carboxylate isomerase [Bradyrhizobium sp. LHD-71]
MSGATLDFWFDFASTYSYVTAMRIAPAAERADVAVRWRPFLLGPIFQAQGLDNSPFNLFQAKGRYMWRDMERLCSDIGTPFRKPDPFPQASLLAARVALVGLDQGWGEDFSRGVFRAEFAEGFDIGKPETLATVLKSLGVAPAEIFDQAQSDETKMRLRAQTDAAAARNIFGAPTFSTAGEEIFWGNDRLEQALAWARRE